MKLEDIEKAANLSWRLGRANLLRSKADMKPNGIGTGIKVTDRACNNELPLSADEVDAVLTLLTRRYTAELQAMGVEVPA